MLLNDRNPSLPEGAVGGGRGGIQYAEEQTIHGKCISTMFRLRNYFTFLWQAKIGLLSFTSLKYCGLNQRRIWQLGLFLLYKT